MTWWCSARGGPWDWSWQAYPGVWLLVALLAGFYLWQRARLPAEADTGHRGLAFTAGLVVLWGAADWPLGPLGAGYLVSVHAGQYLLLSMVVPPLLLYGLPPAMLRSWLERPRLYGLARVLTRPLVAFAIFNVVLVATHLPAVVDTVKVTQFGSFAVDMAWLGAGILFWWQVLGPLPEFAPMSYPGRIVFLLANVFIPTVPAAFLTFADYPIYAVYELAPRASGLTAVQDQQLAGLTMKIVGGLWIFGTASVLFFRWYRTEEPAETATAVGPRG
jgi:cytochrome c oxidase assembly factor CtaG